MNCHQEIASQVQQKNGLHGYWDNVDSCRTCHLDHKGRNFDMVADASSTFDHSQTRLPLSGKHIQLACRDCHTAEEVSNQPGLLLMSFRTRTACRIIFTGLW